MNIMKWGKLLHYFIILVSKRHFIVTWN